MTNLESYGDTSPHGEVNGRLSAAISIVTYAKDETMRVALHRAAEEGRNSQYRDMDDIVMSRKPRPNFRQETIERKAKINGHCVKIAVTPILFYNTEHTPEEVAETIIDFALDPARLQEKLTDMGKVPVTQ